MPSIDLPLPLDDPERLEALYRNEPRAFESALHELPAESHEHLVARAWRARLGERLARRSAEGFGWARVALYASLAALLTRGLYALADRSDRSERMIEFATDQLAFAIIVPLALLLRGPRSAGGGRDVGIGLAALGVWLVLMLYPLEGSDSAIQSLIHAPLLLWCLAGAWIAAAGWRTESARIDYLMRSGEIGVFTTAVLLGGILLTGLTIALFHVIKVDIVQWYMSNIVVMGTAAAPVVAAGLVRLRESSGEPVAPQLARIFAPLALATLAVYAATILVTGRSPHADRDALIVLNWMLVCAAALVTLCVLSPPPASGRQGLTLMNAGIACIAVCVDLLALWAILYRSVAGGLTPNRVAVLGENVLLLVFLTGVMWHLAKMVSRPAENARLRAFVARMLPAFAVWAAFVVVVLPLLFGLD